MEMVQPQWPDHFTQIPQTVMTKHLPLMGVYGFAVFAALCSYANWDTKHCFPSNVALAKRIGCSERQVGTELKKLEKLGFIRWRPGKTKNIRGVWLLFASPAAPVLPIVPNGQEGIPANDSMPGEGIPANDDTLIRKNENNLNENEVKPSAPAEPPRAPEPPKPATDAVPPAKPKGIHQTMIATIHELWEEANPEVKCEWPGVAMTRLKNLRESRPSWTTEQWVRCIRHRFRSEVNLAAPPEDFIGQLPRFLAGPLDRYGAPLNVDEAKGTGGAGHGRISRTAANASAAKSELRAEIAGEGGLDYRSDRGDGGVHGGGRIIEGSPQGHGFRPVPPRR